MKSAWRCAFRRARARKAPWPIAQGYERRALRSALHSALRYALHSALHSALGCGQCAVPSSWGWKLSPCVFWIQESGGHPKAHLQGGTIEGSEALADFCARGAAKLWSISRVNFSTSAMKIVSLPVSSHSVQPGTLRETELQSLGNFYSRAAEGKQLRGEGGCSPLVSASPSRPLIPPLLSCVPHGEQCSET